MARGHNILIARSQVGSVALQLARREVDVESLVHHRQFFRIRAFAELDAQQSVARTTELDN